jgi:hypothetical protein
VRAKHLLPPSNERGVEKKRGNQHGNNVSDDLWTIKDVGE